MERLGEADHVKFAQTCRQFLGSQLEPLHIADPSSFGLPLRFCEHVLVGIDSDRLVKPRCQQQCELAGTTADVEQPACAVERQLLRESLRKRDGVMTRPIV